MRGVVRVDVRCSGRGRRRERAWRGSNWGGKRPGAGRRPQAGSDIPHLRRTGLASRYPSLRELEGSWARACDRGDFRLVHHSIQVDHVHLLVEGEGCGRPGARDEVAGRAPRPCGKSRVRALWTRPEGPVSPRGVEDTDPGAERIAVPADERQAAHEAPSQQRANRSKAGSGPVPPGPRCRSGLNRTRGPGRHPLVQAPRPTRAICEPSSERREPPHPSRPSRRPPQRFPRPRRKRASRPPP